MLQKWLQRVLTPKNPQGSMSSDPPKKLVCRAHQLYTSPPTPPKYSLFNFSPLTIFLNESLQYGMTAASFPAYNSMHLHPWLILLLTLYTTKWTRYASALYWRPERRSPSFLVTWLLETSKSHTGERMHSENTKSLAHLEWADPVCRNWCDSTTNCNPLQY